MNRKRFEEWLERLSAIFPESGTWFYEQSAETQAIWFDILKELEFDDADEALKLMFRAGEVTNRYDRERIPAIVAKHAQEIAFAREQREHARVQRMRLRGQQAKMGIAERMEQIGCGEVFRSLIAEQDRLRAAGTPMTPEQRRAFIDANMPANDPEDGPRYHCPHCRDTGFSTREANGRQHVFACGCDLGDKRADGFKNRGRPIGQIQKTELVF